MADKLPTRERIHDPDRLAALKSTGLLDSPPDEAFDRFTRLAGKIFNVPVSLVSLVDEDRQFFKSYVGLPEPWASKRETALSHSFCQHVVATNEPLIVADAREHPELKHNLAVRDLSVIAYLGIPLTSPRGQPLGSFCAIDTKPRIWTAKDVEVLTELAHAVLTEIEIRQLVKGFQASYLELRDLELQRDELVHMLVHDLRNPLSSLTGGLQFLAKSVDQDTAQREFLALSLDSARSLVRMINDILEVSKADAGRLELQVSKVEPRSLVETALEKVQPLARGSQIALVSKADSQLPRIAVDIDKFGRVMVNLLENAIQHTPRHGQVSLSVRGDDANDAVVFAVADTGEGVPREAFALIFEKFGQAKTRRVRAASSGLGLTFCKKIVEQHGGQIWIESEMGHGATFFCQIPRAPSNEKD